MTKESRIYSGGNTASSINGTGKLESYMQKKQTELLSHIMYKNKFEMD